MRTTEFAHEALLYAGDQGFIDGALPFVLEGLEAGEPVLLVLSAERIEQIRGEVNGDNERIIFADMAVLGANPARIIPAWRRFVAEHGGDETPVRGIGEPIWRGRTPDELVECQRHEELLNLAFAGDPDFRLLCPYDTEALDDAVIDEAVRSHPILVEDGVRRESAAFRGLAAISEPFAAPLPAPPASVQELEFDTLSLASLRQLVTARAVEAGLDESRTGDLVFAVNEVATNSVRHGGGSGVLRVWMGTRWLVCEIEDAGRIGNPLVGREKPAADEGGGRGLWIANQICDLVQVRSFATHNVVRLHIERP